MVLSRVRAGAETAFAVACLAFLVFWALTQFCSRPAFGCVRTPFASFLVSRGGWGADLVVGFEGVAGAVGLLAFGLYVVAALRNRV